MVIRQGAQGVVAAVGGEPGGWALWLDEAGKPNLTYRLFNIARVDLAGTGPLGVGRHSLRFDVENHGGYGKPATLRLFIDGAEAARAELPRTPVGPFALDDGFSTGVDSGSPVGDYPQSGAHGFPLTGAQVESVTIQGR